MNIDVSGNRAQLPGLLFDAKSEVSVAGRGTGKSYAIGFKMDQNIRTMPRSVTSITGVTYGQLLTRTLPSSFKLLNQMGYQKDVNYVIGKRPPSWFKDSYEALNKFDNIISFSNGTRFAMISQSESGSGRGANTDYGIIDEALTIDEEQYNNEVVPTNRGNLEFFGSKSKNPITQHHGYSYFTSMPTSKEGRWVLKYFDYYLQDRGIRLFDIWNRIVALQVDILEVYRQYHEAKDQGKVAEAKDANAEFVRRWQEIHRLQRQIMPFVSKDGVLATVSNAFDNLKMLGMSYIANSQKVMPNLIFLVEIMNMYIDKVTDCFYSIDDSKQVYYTALDSQRLLELANNNGFDFSKMDSNSCKYDRDCDPTKPIDICFDWGSSISLMIVSQERNWDFVANCATKQICETQINEFFVKPDTSSNMMILDLVGKFTAYYAAHPSKVVYYYRDKYGDHKNPAVQNNKTYNELAIEELRKAGWTVLEKSHPGQEIPYSDRFNLWAVILSETNPQMPLWRINGDKCKYTLISMNNAKVKTVDEKTTKDKRSERPDSGVLPEEATHFSDAVDKHMATKYLYHLTRQIKHSLFSGFAGR